MPTHWRQSLRFRAVEDPFVESLLLAARALDDGKAHIANWRGTAPRSTDFSQSLWLASIHSPQSVRLFVGGEERLISALLPAADRYRAYLDSLNDGFTIVIDGISSLCIEWARVAGLFQLASSNRVSMNAYITPPFSVGFRQHSDAHDVLVVQLHGKKSWNVDGLPYGRLLELGDVLAIPYGCTHEAEAGDQPSVHVTLGLHRDSDVVAFRNALSKVVAYTPALRSASPTDRLRESLKHVGALSDEELLVNQASPALVPGEQDVLARMQSWTAQLSARLVPTPNAACIKADCGVLITFGSPPDTTELLVECEGAAASTLMSGFAAGSKLSPELPPNGIDVRSWLQVLRQLQRDGAVMHEHSVP